MSLPLYISFLQSRGRSTNLVIHSGLHHRFVCLGSNLATYIPLFSPSTSSPPSHNLHVSGAEHQHHQHLTCKHDMGPFFTVAYQ